MKQNKQPKKKKGSIGKTIGTIIFTIPIALGALFMYELSFKQVVIETSESPEGTHTVEVIEIGEPKNDGPSTIRLKSSSDEIDVGLHDEGAILDEENVGINWEDEETATIILTGTGQEPTTVTYTDETFEIKEDGLEETP